MSFLCVFDIDDTLLRLKPGIASENDVPGPQDYPVIVPTDVSWSYIAYYKHTEMAFRVQTHLDTLLAFFQSSSFYRMALWTMGTREYSLAVRDALTKMYGLPPDFFLFVWSRAEVRDLMYCKDLRQVYAAFPAFGAHNTLLFDDRDVNVHHMWNWTNGIVLPPFEESNNVFRVLRLLRYLERYYRERVAEDPQWTQQPVLTPQRTRELYRFIVASEEAASTNIP